MLKGDCNECLHGNEPEDSEVCTECGIARKNYTRHVHAVKFSEGYELIYRPVAGAMSIFLPNPCERAINELTRSDLENILEVVQELCERE